MFSDTYKYTQPPLTSSSLIIITSPPPFHPGRARPDSPPAGRYASIPAILALNKAVMASLGNRIKNIRKISIGKIRIEKVSSVLKKIKNIEKIIKSIPSIIKADKLELMEGKDLIK